MINFKQYVNLQRGIIEEGGNANYVRDDGTIVQAEKIDLIKIGRKEFQNEFTAAFKELNKRFKKQYGEPIWNVETKLDTNELYNGSTSFIFDNSIPDNELLKYKSTTGDLDLIIPEDLYPKMKKFLPSLEGKQITPRLKFLKVANDIFEQIITMWVGEFGDYKFVAQVDFEMLPVDMETTTPDEWAKFGHSSSFDDAKVGLKGVAHKYFIRAMIGALSIRDDIVVVTPASTPDKLKLKKLTDLPHLLKFSPKGIRFAYELMQDENGETVKYNGKEVYKEMKPKDSRWETNIREVFKLSFANIEDKPEDVKLFWSFKGLIDLINKYSNKTEVKRIMDRFIELLWSPIAQELEAENPTLDYSVKDKMYTYAINNLKQYKHEKKTDEIIKKYYEGYGRRKLGGKK